MGSLFLGFARVADCRAAYFLGPARPRFAALKGACGDHYSAFGGGRVPRGGCVLVEEVCDVD